MKVVEDEMEVVIDDDVMVEVMVEVVVEVPPPHKPCCPTNFFNTQC